MGPDMTRIKARGIQAPSAAARRLAEARQGRTEQDQADTEQGQQRPPDGLQPGADMGLYLARHGVAVEVVVERTNATVGSTLAALARGCAAGLMVCGAYGHSRLHEWVLGGATRELLERAPVPLLLAH